MSPRSFLLLSGLIAGTVVLRAQTKDIPYGDFYQNFKISQYNSVFDAKSEIMGSPYENDQFVPGDIFTNTNVHYTKIPLRYNMNSGQMEFKRPEGDVYEVSPPEMIDSIIIGTSMYIYSAYTSGSKSLKGFFRVLTRGKPMMLLKTSVILKPAEPPAAYKEAVPATYARRPDEFFLLFQPGEAVKFSGKKDMLEILNSHTGEMDRFIKSNRVKFNRQEDLIPLMNYYYSLAK